MAGDILNEKMSLKQLSQVDISGKIISDRQNIYQSKRAASSFLVIPPQFVLTIPYRWAYGFTSMNSASEKHYIYLFIFHLFLLVGG